MTSVDKYENMLRAHFESLENITQNDFRNEVELLSHLLKDEEKELLIKKLRNKFAVYIDQAPAVLKNNENHEEWLSDNRSKIAWNYWHRYQEYLRAVKNWAPSTVDALDDITDQVLSLLEHPQRKGAWDRRGMVVGNVQSGKTSYYTGLINKALCSGYKVIIVLAGIHNSLRSQTQFRIDEGVLGWDSRENLMPSPLTEKLGVRRINISCPEDVISLTHSNEDGDFQKTRADGIGLNLGNSPVVLVVKKNAHILENLNNWMQGICRNRHRTEVFNNVPLMLIDDEADNASINGKDVARDDKGNPIKDLDPTSINRKIRFMLKLFNQSAYIAFTATPFANIFIYPTPQEGNDEIKKYGKDLFPESFIMNIPTPSNYIGPVKIFGLDKDDKGGLPIIRPVSDQLLYMPQKHDKTWDVPDDIPESLGNAICSFIISCAVRMWRSKKTEHNSMLVHITRFTDVQAQVKTSVRSCLTFYRRSLELNLGNSLEKFKNIWKDDFLKTTKAVNSLLDDNTTMPNWEELQPLLYEAVSKIEVKEINGKSSDVLDYNNLNKRSLYTIAIGGDKLSRGLTLEGLTVSYYLRASTMYDTLMQMGRWFGYKPDYVDLCRLYTTPDLVNCYKHITLASEELREDFEEMHSNRATPKEFGLKVLNHPGVLQVTAANKLRHGIKRKVSFSKSICETVHFSEQKENRKHNLKIISNFIDSMGHYKCLSSNYVWDNIDYRLICDFIGKYKNHPNNIKAHGIYLKKYIESQAQKNGLPELKNWNVILVSLQKGIGYRLDNDLKVNYIERTKDIKRSGENRFSLNNGRLITPVHESLDLNKSQIENARREYETFCKALNKIPSKDTPGRFYRNQRTSTGVGLFLLYLIKEKKCNNQIPYIAWALSFPESKNDKAIEYVVNPVFERLILMEEYDEFKD